METNTLESKTQTGEKKRVFLPMAAPTPGISNFDYATALIDLRKEQGMESFKWLLPTPGFSGWIDEPMSVSSAGKWLRDLLRNFGHGDLDDVGTHSLKITGLAWAAKFGVDITTRALLGGHVPPGCTSTITYSRDALAGPLSKLAEIFRAIRDKTFKPDETRSGRLVTKRARLSKPSHSGGEPTDEGFTIVSSVAEPASWHD